MLQNMKFLWNRQGIIYREGLFLAIEHATYILSNHVFLHDIQNTVFDDTYTPTYPPDQTFLAR